MMYRRGDSGHVVLLGRYASMAKDWSSLSRSFTSRGATLEGLSAGFTDAVPAPLVASCTACTRALQEADEYF